MSNILTNEWCSKCNTDSLTEEYYIDGFVSEYCTNCGYLHEYHLEIEDEESEECFNDLKEKENDEEQENNEDNKSICSCGSKFFVFESLKAFVKDIVINEKGNIIDFNKKNIEFDLDYTPEFCYYAKCGAEIEYSKLSEKC